MARIAAIPFLVLCVLSATASLAQGGAVYPGVITAHHVDVISDSGEALPERLTVGDPVYIVESSGERRAGWVKISRTPDDSRGIGWVRKDQVRSFSRWESAPPPALTQSEPSSAEPSRTEPSRTEPSSADSLFGPDFEAPKYSRVGVLPFASSDPDDPIAKWTYDAFALALRSHGTFMVYQDEIAREKINEESAKDVDRLLSGYNLDGFFTGSISPKVGAARLLQVRFFRKGGKGHVLEKTTRLPEQGNLQEVIDRLVAESVKAISE